MTNKNDGINRPPQQNNKMKCEDKMKKYAVYRIKDASNKTIYIGFSGSAMLRAANHIDNQKWQNEMSSMDFEFFDTKVDAECSEILAIKRYRPKYNTTYNNDEPVRKAVERHAKLVFNQMQKWMNNAETFTLPWGWDRMNEVERLKYETKILKEKKKEGYSLLTQANAALKWIKWCEAA